MIMQNTFREKLGVPGNRPSGLTTYRPIPDIPEIIGDTGLFDYAEYCAEYSTFNMRELYHMARAGQAGNLPLMIKLDQEAQGFWAQAAWGAGFKAILFTDIRTPEDVETVCSYIRPDTPKSGGLMGVKIRRPALSGFEPVRLHGGPGVSGDCDHDREECGG